MHSIIDLTNKTVVITGAASGIGRETAVLASKVGARVVMIDLLEDGLTQTAQMLEGSGHKQYVTDLTDIDGLKTLEEQICADVGEIHGLVHCAGISSRKPLNVLSKQGFSRLMDVNFYSFVELVKLFTKKGRMADGGSIVVMSSISSIKGYKAKTEYCVSKAAADAFVRCMAQELAPKRIRINSIMPGAVNTPMGERAREMAAAVGAEEYEQPLGLTEPVEVANTIAFLLSDATHTITGSYIVIGGGKSLSAKSLANKHILVYGGSTPLEERVIAHLLNEGAELVQMDGQFDVEQMQTQIKEIVVEKGGFDGLVFLKTHSDFRPLRMVSRDNLEAITQDNYFAFIDVVRSLVKAKGLNRGASIVAMSSISSIRAMKSKMAFSASKAAVDAAVRCLAAELGGKGIRVNTIQKGGVDADYEKSHIQDINALNDGATEQRQILGLVKAEEVASAVEYLLCDATKTITGTSIVIDGGYTL